MASSSPTLIPVLGDQLTRTLASLKGMTKDNCVILMMEVWDEATYVRHHKQKIALIFSAMRHFAAELSEAGWEVDYVKLDDPDNAGSFTGEVARAVERHEPERVRIVEAGEWRVQQAIEEWPDKFACEVEILPDDRFLCSHSEFRDWAEDRKHLTMEHFYRTMRRKTGLLMDGDKPAGGDWNYDSENREKLDDTSDVPPRPKFEPDDITIVPAEQMRREAEANLSNPGLFASIGASLPVREKQLDLARRGCEFVLVNAPTDHAETRAKKALAQLPVRYAVKYRHLVIEDMRNQIESTQPHSDAARGA